MLCTVIANAHRDPEKGRAFRVEDFSPYKRETGTIRVGADNIGQMKEAFKGFSKVRLEKVT